MSDHAAERLQAQLESLDRLLAWIKALIVGAFLVGVWSATLQLKIVYLDDRVTAIERDRERALSDWQDWRQSISSDVAATRSDVRWLREYWERHR